MTSKITRLRHKADKLFQIKGLASNKFCLVCGSLAQVIHHFFPKSIASSLRYYLPNGIPLCNRCHFVLHNGDPTVPAKILEVKGEGWLNDLIKKRKEVVQTTVGYFEDTIKNLEL